MIDLLYLCHDRIEFTKATLPNLIATTPWTQVNEFVIYNDASEDPAVAHYLSETVRSLGFGKVRTTQLGSPVAVMAHFLQRCRAEMFAKIDNDIIVPAGWFETLVSVLERSPDLELLGMEPGMSGVQPIAYLEGSHDERLVYGYKEAAHIGGVGMMRRSAFQRLPDLVPNGRFGFTEWQHNWNPLRGWVQPDLRMFSLDFLPVEPWRSITEGYMKVPGLQREWPKYDPSMSWHWEWWT